MRKSFEEKIEEIDNELKKLRTEYFDRQNDVSDVIEKIIKLCGKKVELVKKQEALCKKQQMLLNANKKSKKTENEIAG